MVLSTMAAYAFARFTFRGANLVFMLVLMQLMVMPDILIVENYATMNKLGLRDTILSIGLPYFASAFGNLVSKAGSVSVAYEKSKG